MGSPMLGDDTCDCDACRDRDGDNVCAGCGHESRIQFHINRDEWLCETCYETYRVVKATEGQTPS